MKALLATLLIVEFLVAYIVFVPQCVRRQDQVRAFVRWRENPTPAAKAELDRQRLITEFWRLGFSTAVFAVLGGVTIFVVGVGRRKTRCHWIQTSGT